MKIRRGSTAFLVNIYRGFVTFSNIGKQEAMILRKSGDKARWRYGNPTHADTVMAIIHQIKCALWQSFNAGKMALWISRAGFSMTLCISRDVGKISMALWISRTVGTVMLWISRTVGTVTLWISRAVGTMPLWRSAQAVRGLCCRLQEIDAISSIYATCSIPHYCACAVIGITRMARPLKQRVKSEAMNE